MYSGFADFVMQPEYVLFDRTLGSVYLNGLIEANGSVIE